MLRYLVFALLLVSPAAAQQVTPSFGLDQSGTLRNLSVRDPTLNGFVPFGILDTTTHSFVAPTPVEQFGATGDSNGTTGNGTDDTAAFIASQALGVPISLRAGATYRVTHAIDLGAGGFVGPASSTVYADPAGFTNATSDFTARYGNTAAVFRCMGQTVTPFTPLAGCMLHGFKIVGGAGNATTDDRDVSAIAGRNVTRVEISNMEITGFPLGFGVNLHSVLGGFVRDNYIHDFYDDNTWTAANGGCASEPCNPQMTGILFDADTVNNIWSKNIRITGNRVDNLAVGPAFFAQHGYQSDGINYVSHDVLTGNGVIISGNTLSRLGEGIDNFSERATITGNNIFNTLVFGIKMIHGASYGIIADNTIANAGYAGITLNGSSTGRNTAHNVIIGNNIQNVGEDDWSGIDLFYGISSADTACIQITPDTPGISTSNLITQNTCDPGPKGKVAWSAKGLAAQANDWIANRATPGSLGLVLNNGEVGRFTTAAAEAWAAEATVASAATTSIFAAQSNRVAISGTTGITSFGAGWNGTYRYVRFLGALTLTHNAVSLILPTGANITTVAGDTALIVSEGGSNARMLAYWQAAPAAILTVPSTNAGSGPGPVLLLDRDSASPTAGDSIGQVNITGRDDAGNVTPYATIGSTILNAVDAAEASRIDFSTASAGTYAARVFISTGLSVGTSSSPGTGAILATGTITGAGITSTAGVKVGPSLVSALPTCNAGIEGTARGVSDANATTYNAAVVGGGTNHMPVYCNGTAWVLH